MPRSAEGLLPQFAPSAGVFWTQIQQAEKPGMGERCDLEATFFQQI
jgi:hypothetical protein